MIIVLKFFRGLQIGVSHFKVLIVDRIVKVCIRVCHFKFWIVHEIIQVFIKGCQINIPSLFRSSIFYFAVIHLQEFITTHAFPGLYRCLVAFFPFQKMTTWIISEFQICAVCVLYSNSIEVTVYFSIYMCICFQEWLVSKLDKHALSLLLRIVCSVWPVRVSLRMLIMMLLFIFWNIFKQILFLLFRLYLMRDEGQWEWCPALWTCPVTILYKVFKSFVLTKKLKLMLSKFLTQRSYTKFKHVTDALLGFCWQYKLKRCSNLHYYIDYVFIFRFTNVDVIVET